MPPPDDPMAAVRQYVDAFNNGDVQAMAAACADPMQILDGMAPHVWQGPTAAEDWWKDVLAEGEHLGASGYRITLGEPQHVDVNGVSGYVVVPATMAFDATRSGGHTNRLGIHCRAPQDRRRLAFSGLGVGQRHTGRIGKRRGGCAQVLERARRDSNP